MEGVNMKTSLRWKTACAAVATITLFNLPLLAQPAMAAPPPVCIQWGWAKCDPVGPRFSPAWNECFEYYTTEGCPWWDGTLTSKSAPQAVKPEDMEKLVRQ
jgi:hypothetical protein